MGATLIQESSFCMTIVSYSSTLVKKSYDQLPDDVAFV